MLELSRLVAFAANLLWASCTLAQQTQAEPFSRFYEGYDKYRLAPRTALVIGIGKVSSDSGFQNLPNPPNDAREVTKTLRRLGFTVFSPNESYAPESLTRQVVKRALYDFSLTLQRLGGIGLVYFSGHGLEVGANTYLLPYDGLLRYMRDLDEELIPVSWFYDAFSFADNKLNLLVIDSCRDFPLSGKLPEFAGPQASPPLVKPLLDSPSVLRASSTLSGWKALDGIDGLSPYASAFVESLKSEDVNLGALFKTVASIADKKQAKATFRQTSSFLDKGYREFVIHPTTKSFNDERTIWETGTREMIEKLAETYPAGYFSAAAREWIKNAPIEKPPRLTFDVAVLDAITDIYTRDQPSRTAKVIGHRPQASRYVAPTENLRTYGEWTCLQDVGVLKCAERSKLKFSKPEVKAIALDFEPEDGTSAPKLSSATLVALQNFISSNGPKAIARVRFSSPAPANAKTEVPSLASLAREAAVINALKQFGVSPEEVVVAGPGMESSIARALSGGLRPAAEFAIIQ